jgi:hypothetical protein
MGPALAEKWRASDGTYWAFPPYSLIGEVIKHWRRSPGARVVLLAPEDHPAVTASWRSGDVLRSVPFPAGHKLLDPANKFRAAPYGPSRRLRAFLLGHSGPESRALRAASARSWLDLQNSTRQIANHRPKTQDLSGTKRIEGQRTLA